ncbi:unnamed protein product [Leptosia nina]|uniref:Uncharacterized protein n=1 Tax=Leptosia nina TaxID=320188 RepID=A0AAV1JAE3_9NEOP
MKSTEQVFEEKGSMEDYFKSKMAALKTKKNIELPKTDDNEENPDFVFQGFALDTDDTTDKVKTVSFYNNDNDEVQELTTVDYTIKKKSKKNKKEKI